MSHDTRRGYFIAGIGTNVGKTVVAAIVAESLQAAYWKPIQCGDLHYTDTDIVSSLTSNVKTYPEAYRFSLPASPHLAASAEGVKIDIAELELPNNQNSSHKMIVVEGAGGIMVPLNPQTLMLNYINHLGLPVILVSKNYLGSINHTLLSIHALNSTSSPIKGIIFSGTSDPKIEETILQYSGVHRLGHVPWTECLDRSFVTHHASQGWLHELL
jgi:dethiobiotin synthetase